MTINFFFTFFPSSIVGLGSNFIQSFLPIDFGTSLIIDPYGKLTSGSSRDCYCHLTLLLDTTKQFWAAKLRYCFPRVNLNLNTTLTVFLLKIYFHDV